MQSSGEIFYKKKLFWWICGIPSLVSMFYLFLWATPRYESTAIVRVYEAGQGAQASSSAAMEGMGGASASPGSYVLTKYISSWDAFQALNPQKLKKHWQGGDWPSSFGGPLSLFSSNQMRLWAYYKNHVTAKLDETSSLITINVDGYSADFVWKLNNDVLQLARAELAQSGIKADQAEHDMLVNKIIFDRKRLSDDLDAISELQRQAGISDLKSDYQAVLGNLAAAEKERINISTRAAATAFLAARGEQMATLKIQLASLDQEIKQQRAEIGKRSSFYKKYGQMEDQIQTDSKLIMLDEEGILENEQNSIRHAYYLDFVEHPVHPTDPTRPLALMWTLILFSATFVLYLILK